MENGSSGKLQKKVCKRFVFDPPPEAPIFRPTAEEFKNPLEYIKKIRPIGEKTGICKIVPPPGWKTPFALNPSTLKFTPRIQRINELEARTRIKLNFNDKLTKFFALSGKTFQVPLMEKTSLDLYTLYRKVKERGGVDIVNKEKHWGEIASQMGFTCKTAPVSLKNHYDNLVLPFLLSQTKKSEEDKENRSKDDYSEFDEETGELKVSNAVGKGQAAMRELRSLRFLGPGPKMAICDKGALEKGLRTRGKKVMYEFDPLAKYMCKGCSKGDIEETFLVMCTHCEDRYHHLCLIPPLSVEQPPANWRCPKCVAAEGYKPLEEFGFAQAEREYTLNEFRLMANDFKRNYFDTEPEEVDRSKVEQEFWRVVSSIDEAVTVEYGADLHVIEHGSGFPRLDQPRVEGVDQKKYERYASSPWNLNNLPVLEDSVLKHISADISGMKIPWMYAGMCFATFCWHNEDHWSYSINYLHLGEAKTWYGVPGSYAEQFEKAMQKAAPELFESQPDLLHQLVTIMNPNDIMAAGVPVYRTDQKRGEFVITFPRAYHAGFNQGFNFAEACNFAPADWLVIGRQCIHHYSQLRRNCVFSHDELVVGMTAKFDSLKKDIALVLIKDTRLMVEAERLRRTRALRLGVGNAVHIQFDQLPDDERQCCICNTTLFLSAITCPCDFSRLVCLDHITKLCGCETKKYIMKYQLKLDALQDFLVVMSNKLCGFDNWTNRVQEALNNRQKKKMTLTNLTQLLVEAKEKEFPPSELVDLLEYHVRRCMECNTLSKAIVATCRQTEEPSKITVEDLELFCEELDKLPCTLAEESAVKEILGRAKEFQKTAEDLFALNTIAKSQLISCIQLGKSLNLVLVELQTLEDKLIEVEWIEQVESAINCEADKDVVSKLVEQGKTLSGSAIISQSKKKIEEYLLKCSSKSTITISNVQSLHPSCIHNLIDTQRMKISFFLQKVLSGKIVLHLNNLENIIVKSKRELIEVDSLKSFEESVSVVRNWFAVMKSQFVRNTDAASLMETLWPRKYISRHMYHAMKATGKSPFEPMIIKDTDYWTKKNFEKAYQEELESLNQLRLENLKMLSSDVPSNIKCICGLNLNSKTIVCELCYTAMHLRCFRETDSSENHPHAKPQTFDSNFRLKRLCGFCRRSNRPSMASVEHLVRVADEMNLKVPECYAIKWSWLKIVNWRKNLKKIIETKVLKARSDEIISYFKKFHARRHQIPSTDADDSDSILKLGPTDQVPRLTMLLLKEELIQGNRFEITIPEVDQVWNVINPLWIHSEIESGVYNAFCRNDRVTPPTEHLPMMLVLPAQSAPLPVSSMSSPQKKSLKRKSLPERRPVTNTNPFATPVTIPVTLIEPSQKVVKRRKRGPNSKKKKKPSFPSVTEEHEPEANCASASCLKPGDAAVDWVMCDGVCKQWFHMKCVDLENKTLSDDMEYICNKCACIKVCEQVTQNLNNTV